MTSVLIVEDEESLLHLYEIIFEKSWFDVKTAINWKIAYDMICWWYSPDIMLTDIMMPWLNWFELLEKVVPMLLNTNFFVISNLSDINSIEKARAFPIKEFIIKSNFTPKEVVEKVKSYI